MRTLFFDTETTGLPDFNKRASDPSQPHLCQLAWIRHEDGRETGAGNRIVKPEGWEIPVELTAIHGISNEMAHSVGAREIIVVDEFWREIKAADKIVCFGVQFDKFIMRIAARRVHMMQDSDDEWWKGIPSFCVMKVMTPICAIPSKTGRGFKYPKLMEAHMHAFGSGFEGAHDALEDVRATVRLYEWIQRQPDASPGVEAVRAKYGL